MARVQKKVCFWQGRLLYRENPLFPWPYASSHSLNMHENNRQGYIAISRALERNFFAIRVFLVFCVLFIYLFWQIFRYRETDAIFKEDDPFKGQWTSHLRLVSGTCLRFASLFRVVFVSCVFFFCCLSFQFKTGWRPGVGTRSISSLFDRRLK